MILKKESFYKIFLIMALAAGMISILFGQARADNIWTIGTGGLPGGSAIVVTNVSIVRAADSVGSGVTVSWEVTPAGSAVDVWTRTGIFDTVATSWTKEQSNYVPTDWTDANQVGVGTQKYYKVMPAGAALTNADLGSSVVGKFDITIVGSSNVEKILLSSPLIPTAGGIDLAIGSQLTGGLILPMGDQVNKYNGSGFDIAWLRSSDTTWRDMTGAASPMMIDPDVGYWINIAPNHPTQTITLVGGVASSSRSGINITANDNLVGSAYPVSVSLASSGLESSGATKGLFMSSACQITKYDFATDSYETAWLDSSGTWRQSTGVQPSSMQLEPGSGYWIKEPPTSSGFTWNYPLPY